MDTCVYGIYRLCDQLFSEGVLSEEINYQQWKTNDNNRLERVKLSDSISIVLDKISENFEFFLFHDFVKNVQAKSFQEKKENLSPTEALFHFDFSENYQFVPQDEIQSGHWDHQSCTLFTVLVHYKDDIDNSIKHESFVIVSDYMNHDKYAVKFQMNLRNYTPKL